jgi:opacity protein-like surface antigen
MIRKRQHRYRFVQLCQYVLAGVCAFVMSPAVGHAQVDVPRGTSEQATTQAERAERARQAERARAGDVVAADRMRHEEHHRPGEMYVGGFGGYTFGHSFSNGELFGAPNRGLDLDNSGVYGAKIGYFMPDRLNWLGFEVEGFNSSPNIKQSAPTVPGASLRVTTLAFNAIIRGKFGCGPSRNEPSRRTTTESHSDAYGHREDTFCPLQPYVGAGLGLFFAHTNGIGGAGSASDNAVPGFNGLAGIRYFVTEHVAVFGEYKYNRATFNFDNVGVGGGLKGDYSVSHVVGGLSFHF